MIRSINSVTLRLAVLLTLGAACSNESDGSLPTADAFGGIPALTACASAAAGNDLFGFDATGTVTEIGSGDPPNDCFRNISAFVGRGVPNPDDADEAAWLRAVDSNGAGFVVGLFLEGSAPPPLAVGEQVHVTTARSFSFSGTVAEFTLRGADGSTLAWVSVSEPSLQGHPRIEVSRGTHVGREPTGCSWDDLYEAEVQVDDVTGSVPFRGSAEVGGFQFVNASFVNNVWPTGCEAPPDAPSGEGFMIGAVVVPASDG